MKSMLRKYIRQLLSEAAKGPADLPDDVFVRFEVDDGLVEIFYTDARGGQFRSGVDKIYGTIQIVKDESGYGPCAGSWMVAWSRAAPGWGPMLYDLAIEFATKNGTGLMSDRREVSSSAANVWTHYMNKRPDVVGTQLDDLDNTLTPSYRDNCDQNISGQKWMTSPLSKMWSKKSVTIDKLRSMGKLIE